MNINRNSLQNEFISSLQLRVVDSGYADVATDWNMQRVCSPYSRLYLIQEGEGRIRHAGRTIVLKAGHAYLIPAQLTFDYECDGFMKQLYFHLNLYAADGHDLLSLLDSCLETPLQEDTIETAIRAYGGKTLADAILLQQSITIFLTGFIQASPLVEQVLQAPSPFLRELYTLARQSIDVRTTVKTLAEKMAMAPGTLARHFKEETGMTPGHYLDGLLIQRAQHLLLSTDDPIGRISDQLGFCDQFYFSRYFRQHRQETPSQYRLRLRNGF